MDGVIEWGQHRVVDAGVVERPFRLVRDAAAVPCVLWLPSSSECAPRLVLLGHGGSGHKTSERNVSLALWFASHAGLATLAIDGPYHGDRVPAPMPAAEYQARIAAEGIGVVLDRVADEWLAVIDTLGALEVADTDNLGYLGMSMGTRFGLPLAAILGDRLRCVAFGKFGLQQTPRMTRGLEAPQRVASDARRVTVPALFHMQWYDEVFPKDGQLALFDLLGSSDKQLIAFTGTHAQTKPAAVAIWRDFVTGHLATGT